MVVLGGGRFLMSEVTLEVWAVCQDTGGARGGLVLNCVLASDGGSFSWKRQQGCLSETETADLAFPTTLVFLKTETAGSGEDSSQARLHVFGRHTVTCCLFLAFLSLASFARLSLSLSRALSPPAQSSSRQGAGGAWV